MPRFIALIWSYATYTHFNIVICYIQNIHDERLEAFYKNNKNKYKELDSIS